MKFLHAADIHLDSPLAGLARRGAVPAHVTQDSTRKAFANLIELAITEDVAFLLIAGDLYDSDWRDFSTGLFFNEQMRKLRRPCIIVRGNHDAASVITSKLTLPDNVHVMSTRKVDRWASDEAGIVIHGRSFPDRHVTSDLSELYPGPESGRLSIAMLHTSAEDTGGVHDVYAPCRVAGLVGKNYDYWALGHIHDRRALSSDPFVIFPGNLQGRHVGETGAKGATLVEVSEGRIVEATHRPLDVLRWARIEVPLDGAETMGDVATRLRLEIEAQAGDTGGRPLIARGTLTGETGLHAPFTADPAAIEAECLDAAASAQTEIYIERVQLRTCMPRQAGQGASESLAAAFAGGLDDPELVRRVLEDFKRLRQDLPAVPGAAREAALPDSPEALRALLEDAWHLAERALRDGEAA